MFTDLGIGLFMIGLGWVHLPIKRSGETGGALAVVGGILYLAGTIGPMVG